MNKKTVAIFLILMVLCAGAILLGIRLVQGGVFEKKTTVESTILSEVTTTASSETSIEETVSFATEADAINYIMNYASTNSIDFTLYPQPIYRLLVKNPSALDFVLNYPMNVTSASSPVEGDENSENDEELPTPTPIVSLDGTVSTARITPLYTWDSRWGYTEYGNGTFCFTGSAPTCVSMVAMYLLRNPAFSPSWVAAYSMGNGYCNSECDGSSEAALVGDGGYGLGINVTQIPASDPERIKRNLDVPNPIICDVGDHYIILISYEEDDFTVIDPTSEYDTNRTWSWSELSSRLEGLWVYRVL